MHILMLSHSYPPLLGGIEQHVQNLSRTLVARGHQVSIATLAAGGQLGVTVEDGIAVHRLQGTVHRAIKLLYSDPGRPYAPPFADPEVSAALYRLCRNSPPDIVHAHNWMVHSYLPLKPLLRVPLVITLHDYHMVCAKWNLIRQGEACSGPSPAKCLPCSLGNYGAAKGMATYAGSMTFSPLERRMADRILAVSQAVALGNQLDRAGTPYEVVPNFVTVDAGMPSDELTPYLSQLPAPGYLLFVGALAISKGVQVLLRAYERMSPTVPLVLIGYDTADTAQLLKQVPDNVSVLRNWPRAAVLQAWQRCSIGIVPSIWPEPCPTVALEAMYYGKPVVASNMGGLPDMIVDGESGYLVEPGDSEMLRVRLEQLLEDADLRGRLGRAARIKVEQFQPESVVSHIERVYRQLTSTSADE